MTRDGVGLGVGYGLWWGTGCGGTGAGRVVPVLVPFFTSVGPETDLYLSNRRREEVLPVCVSGPPSFGPFP